MNGEGTIHVRMLDEAIQSAVALTGEASLRCLKYLWPRSRRHELWLRTVLIEIGRVRTSPGPANERCARTLALIGCQGSGPGSEMRKQCCSFKRKRCRAHQEPS